MLGRAMFRRNVRIVAPNKTVSAPQFDGIFLFQYFYYARKFCPIMHERIIMLHTIHSVAVWCSGNASVSINAVALH